MIWGVLALAGIAGAILWYARKAGKDEAEAKIERSYADAAARAGQAAADGPRTRDDVADRLHDRKRDL